MTTRDSNAPAYIGSQGLATAHTMRCATVGRYERLRNGVGRGQCPNLTESTYGHVMQQIEARRLFECKLCKRQREAEAGRFHTADGTEAFPIEGDDLKWLVRPNRYTWWVIELTGSKALGEIDLGDTSRDSGFMIPGVASRVFADEISDDMRENHPGAGWFYQLDRTSNEVPYRRMADAIDGLLLAVAEENRRLAELHAEHAQREARITAAAEPIRCLTHPSVTTDGRHGARLAIPACESGADYGVWCDDDAGFLTSFDCAVRAAGYAAELLDQDDEQVFEVKRLCRDHEDQPHDGCAACFAEGDEPAEGDGGF